MTQQKSNLGDLLAAGLSALMADENATPEQKQAASVAAVLGGIPGDYDIRLVRLDAPKKESELEPPAGNGWYLVSLHGSTPFFALWARPPKS